MVTTGGFMVSSALSFLDLETTRGRIFRKMVMMRMLIGNMRRPHWTPTMKSCQVSAIEPGHKQTNKQTWTTAPHAWSLKVHKVHPAVTYWKEHRWARICRDVPEGDVDGHGAEEQAHAAGDPLSTCEGAPRRRIHDGDPDVFISETSRCSALENVPERKKNNWTQSC